MLHLSPRVASRKRTRYSTDFSAPTLVDDGAARTNTLVGVAPPSGRTSRGPTQARAAVRFVEEPTLVDPPRMPRTPQKPAALRVPVVALPVPALDADSEEESAFFARGDAEELAPEDLEDAEVSDPRIRTVEREDEADEEAGYVVHGGRVVPAKRRGHGMLWAAVVAAAACAALYPVRDRVRERAWPVVVSAEKEVVLQGKALSARARRAFDRATMEAAAPATAPLQSAATPAPPAPSAPAASPPPSLPPPVRTADVAPPTPAPSPAVNATAAPGAETTRSTKPVAAAHHASPPPKPSRAKAAPVRAGARNHDETRSDNPY